ncbi:MAG TPA: glycosyltransferase family 2 protein [Anaerolineales bacterium]|nr:glycosyltransferase family 2 protein [Anaerolineales bacterium]
MSNETIFETITFVIVTWNQFVLTKSCIDSIYKQFSTKARIILVDNGSDDYSGTLLKNCFPEIFLITFQHNFGPTYAFVIGLQKALEFNDSFIFLLNNDTVLEPMCSYELVKTLKLDDTLAMAFPIMLFKDEPTRIWSAGIRTFLGLRVSYRDEYLSNIPEKAFYIHAAPFCGVLFRRETLETIGFPDTHYKLYYEDWDYCRRVRMNNKKMAIQPQSLLYHAVSASSGGEYNRFKAYWLAKSNIRYDSFHSAKLYFPFALLINFITYFLKIINMFFKSNNQVTFAYLQGFWDGIQEIYWQRKPKHSQFDIFSEPNS